MGVKATLVDAFGNPLKINGEGEIQVTVHTHPPEQESIPSFPIQFDFTDDAGSNNMVINGATTPTKFSVRALDDAELFIKRISVRLGDAGANFNEFGALPALSNGVQWSWVTSTGTVVLKEAIKDNLDWFRMSGQTPVIVDLSGGGADAVVVDLDMTKTFGMPYGIRLRKGSIDELSFTVRDNLAGITTFNMEAYGITLST